MHLFVLEYLSDWSMGMHARLAQQLLNSQELLPVRVDAEDRLFSQPTRSLFIVACFGDAEFNRMPGKTFIMYEFSSGSVKGHELARGHIVGEIRPASASPDTFEFRGHSEKFNQITFHCRPLIGSCSIV